MDEGVCIECLPGCWDCQNSTTCDYCYPEFYINWNNTICSENCNSEEEILDGEDFVYH